MLSQPNNEVMKLIVFILLALAAVGFIYGIYSAYEYSILGTPEDMPAFLHQVVVGIGGVLATNLGAVFGIEIKNPSVHGNGKNLFLLQGKTPSVLQMLAAYLYIIGLGFGLYAWYQLGFTEDLTKIVALIPQLSQTLLGVIVGILVVYLGK